MTYVIKFNGEKVRTFNDPLYAKAWANRFCKGKVEIVSLTETSLPKASKLKFNVNKGQYKYNPFKMLA